MSLGRYKEPSWINKVGHFICSLFKRNRRFEKIVASDIIDQSVYKELAKIDKQVNDLIQSLKKLKDEL
jgi:hypothetical protein